MTSPGSGVIRGETGLRIGGVPRRREAPGSWRISAVALPSGLGSRTRLSEKPGLLTTELRRGMDPDALGSPGHGLPRGGCSSWAKWKAGFPTSLELRGAEVRPSCPFGEQGSRDGMEVMTYRAP